MKRYLAVRYYAVRTISQHFGIRYQIKEAREISSNDKVRIPFNTWDEADIFCTSMNGEFRETI